MEDITRLAELLPRFSIEILVAVVCGGLIGLERRHHKTAASLRDYILICLGAVLYMKMAELLALKIGLNPEGDPGKIASQVIIGISLIGAATVVSTRGNGQGISTAATFWVVAAIGLTIGVGYPLLAMLITGAILLTLTVLGSLEKHLKRPLRPFVLRLTVKEDTPELRNNLKKLLESKNVHPESFRAEPGPTSTKLIVRAPEEPENMREIVANLWTMKGILEVER